jgi:hypothetical protein
MASAMVQVNSRLPRDLYELLTERADSEDRSLTSVVNRALRAYLTPTEQRGDRSNDRE